MIYTLFRSAVKKIFVSFDFEHDRDYRYLLSALNSNTGSKVTFEDFTPSEIRSIDVGRIKAALTGKLAGATHALIVIGKHANSLHPDRARIGTQNWQWWEIEKSKELKKRLIAVKIERANPAPTPLLNSNATWAHSFNVLAIIQAIADA
jgi:MTH538 TIR-like domain (DUF1863)